MPEASGRSDGVYQPHAPAGLRPAGACGLRARSTFRGTLSGHAGPGPLVRGGGFMTGKRVLIAALVAALFAIVPSAFPDQVFHPSHAALHSVGGAPLKSGFVNDIHMNGEATSA